MENRQGEGKNSIGNVEAKELIYRTHGHELNGGNVVIGINGLKFKLTKKGFCEYTIYLDLITYLKPIGLDKQ